MRERTRGKGTRATARSAFSVPGPFFGASPKRPPRSDGPLTRHLSNLCWPNPHVARKGWGWGCRDTSGGTLRARWGPVRRHVSIGEKTWLRRHVSHCPPVAPRDIANSHFYDSRIYICIIEKCGRSPTVRSGLTDGSGAVKRTTYGDPCVA